MKHYILILITLLIAIQAYAQHDRHQLSFYTGYAVGVPDKRYDFLLGKYNPSLDDEYTAGFQYKYAVTPRLKIGLGIGYAQLVQDFRLPVENTYFSLFIEPLLMRRKSYYHMIQLQPAIEYTLIDKPIYWGVQASGISNISFRKKINKGLIANKKEYFSSEVYGGGFVGYKRFRLDVGYRALHRKHKDDALANNGLEIDPYNPAKWRFLLSFDLSESK